jgi:aminopeptidase N
MFINDDKISLQETHLKDYTPPNFIVESLSLEFDLDKDLTLVKSTFVVSPEAHNKNEPLILLGEKLKLLSIELNGKILAASEYQLSDKHLIISTIKSKSTLVIQNEISPIKNTDLSGLYYSNELLCTQCEAEGFRRITFFLDRPDVLTTITTKLIANKKEHPVLLSNGDIIDEGDVGEEKHFVTWKDPHKKPCYLFAIVAGDLSFIEDYYKTSSGKDVTLRIFAEKKNIANCAYALTSLKKAMQWDERTYNREYDLSLYMIVAVNDFNYGAMENKGLNIFNTKYILANPSIATDVDYNLIDIVVAHEYFHNWSGNRVTLRDWFQLSLKEGFTVFREQSFNESITSKTIARITQVKDLRDRQFQEDSSPLAHPVQPDSYIRIDNFYTYTIYEKGGELVRMLKIIVGEENFIKGAELYFKKFDGKAVTIDDFIQSLQDASGVDLNQFKHWYKLKGTPTIRISSEVKDGDFYLHVEQLLPSNVDSSSHFPLHIPMLVRLYDKEGNEVEIKEEQSAHRTKLIELKEESHSYKFQQAGDVTPSLFCHFSAPVYFNYDYTDKEIEHLIIHDKDGFNQWELLQYYHLQVFQRLIEKANTKKPLVLDKGYINLLRTLSETGNSDKFLFAELLTFPSINFFVGKQSAINVECTMKVFNFMQDEIGKNLKETCLLLYKKYTTDAPYEYNLEQASSRKIRNLALYYLMRADFKKTEKLVEEQFLQSYDNNMTDSIAALQAINNCDTPLRKKLFQLFYQKFKAEPIALNKWFSLQASSFLPHALAEIIQLKSDPYFDGKNPNNIMALFGNFAQFNFPGFHAPNGMGYEFVKNVTLEVDALNPMVASRLIKPLSSWKKFDGLRQRMMRSQLESLLHEHELSPNLFEIINESLT